MKKIEDECVGCSGLGLPCYGNSCPNRNVPHWFCDCCGEETDELYYFDDEELCADCVLSKLEKVQTD